MKTSESAVSLDETLAHYRPRIASFINRAIYNSTDVDDLTQETLIRVSKGWHRFRGDGKLSTWIFQIASNVCVDYFRAKSSRPELSGKDEESPELSKTDNVMQSLEQKEMSDCVHEVMEGLPDAYRQVLILHDIEGVKLKDIATSEGETMNNIKVRVHRARKKFRAILENACVFENDSRNILLCEPKVPCKGKSDN